MTNRQPEFLECEQEPELQPWRQTRRRTSADGVADGFDHLVSRHENGRWSSSHSAEFDHTSRILVFFKDVPPFRVGHRLRRTIDESLDWLVEAHAPDAAWQGCSGKDEAGSTAVLKDQPGLYFGSDLPQSPRLIRLS